MPDNIDKTLNVAIIATNAEREEKALVQEDRGTNVRVFAVGGNRGGTPGNNYQRYEGPRGKFQWSNRGAWSQHRAGPAQDSKRVDGTYSNRTDSLTSMQPESQVQTIGGGAASGPGNDDDRCAPRPRGIRCYNCGLSGHILSNCP